MNQNDPFQRPGDEAAQQKPRRRRYHPETERTAETDTAVSQQLPQAPMQHPPVNQPPVQPVPPHYYAAPAAQPYSQPHPASAAQHPQADLPHVQLPSEKAAELDKTQKSRALSRLLLILCACIFAVSAFLLIRYFVNIAITRMASAQLEEVYSSALQSESAVTVSPTPSPLPEATQPPSATAVPTATTAPVRTVSPITEAGSIRTSNASQPSASELWPSKYANNPTLRISSVFYELQRQNKDIIGWLKIDGVLEEAVVQRDNDYYLTHNALGQRSVTGALFLDETCDLKTVPTQMVVHGHNMKEGAMFGSLKKYKVKDASFYRAHPFIDFNTIYENSRYVIFAVSEVDIRWDRADYLPFWRDVRFTSADAFMEYVNEARALSHYRCNVDVQPGDRLLTLSTCTGTDDNKRLIIMARRLRAGENELELNTSILTTSDR